MTFILSDMRIYNAVANERPSRQEKWIKIFAVFPFGVHQHNRATKIPASILFRNFLKNIWIISFSALSTYIISTTFSIFSCLLPLREKERDSPPIELPESAPSVSIVVMKVPLHVKILSSINAFVLGTVGLYYIFAPGAGVTDGEEKFQAFVFNVKNPGDLSRGQVR